ncbi:MAG: ribosomal protection-like ABC-F family protein [Bacillota bacterium]
MVIIELKSIAKSFGIEEVLTDFDLSLQKGERIGLIGRNGSGKTTLFKIIAGLEKPDEGQILLNNEVEVGLLSQEPDLNSKNTIYQECLTVFKRELKLQDKLNQLEEKIADISQADNNDKEEKLEELLQEYSSVQEKFANSAGYSYESRIKQVATGLGVSLGELDKKISYLSGGEKTRVGLVKLLLKEPDLLLLDEPTNHLDISSVEWLEDYLNSYPGSVIIISHDRYFLDRTISRIVEIEYGSNEEYPGNYSYYLEERERRYEIRLKKYQEQQKKIKKIKEQIEQYRVFGNAGAGDNEKFHRQAKSLEKKLEKMERIPKPQKHDNISLNLQPDKRSGSEVLKVTDIDLSFAEEKLLDGINFNLFRGDKAALIGPNGSGKTSILKMIISELKPDQGKIKIGHGVEVGYYAQQEPVFNPEDTMLHALQMKTGLKTGEARDLLAKFLFRGEDVFKKIKSLSGGEISRLRLLQLMYSGANFLILDEPTNHLDLDSREILEASLNDYKGTVLVVSHDRYFLNKVVNTIYEIKSKNLTKFHGDYDYYLKKRKDLYDDEDELSQNEKSSVGRDEKFYYEQKAAQREERRRKREKEKLEAEIEELEERKEQLEEKMISASYEGEFEKLNTLTQEINKIDAELTQRYKRWEEVV